MTLQLICRSPPISMTDTTSLFPPRRCRCHSRVVRCSSCPARSCVLMQSAPRRFRRGPSWSHCPLSWVSSAVFRPSTAGGLGGCADNQGGIPPRWHCNHRPRCWCCWQWRKIAFFGMNFWKNSSYLCRCWLGPMWAWSIACGMCGVNVGARPLGLSFVFLPLNVDPPHNNMDIIVFIYFRFYSSR